MKTRAQKQEDVIKLTQKFSKAKSVVFADYRGLTMKQLSELRDKLYNEQAEFTVTKNTLLERAITQRHPASEARRIPLGSGSNHEMPKHQPKADRPLDEIRHDDLFSGPTATLFTYDDEISPIKLLVKALKDAGIGKIKAGFLGSNFLDEYRVISLSNLPTKDELRGQTVGILAAPLNGIVGVLQGNLRNLVYALSEIQKMKGGV